MVGSILVRFFPDVTLMFRSETRSLDHLNNWSQTVNTRLTNCRFSHRLAGSLAAIFLVVLSGCGGISRGAHNSNTGPAPTALSYSASPITCTQGSAITASPTSTGGAVTSYSVTPPLPAGHRSQQQHRPDQRSPSQAKDHDYLYGDSVERGWQYDCASDDNREHCRTVEPGILESHCVLHRGRAHSRKCADRNRRSTHYVWDGAEYHLCLPLLSPALPAGLRLSPGAPAAGPAGPTISAGVIVGTPTATTNVGPYTVTASNPAGSTTATLMIEVLAAPGGSTQVLAPAGLSYSAPRPGLPAGVAITRICQCPECRPNARGL